MVYPNWSLQDAKNGFSSMVDAALAGEPQLVTRHGKPAVVVVSAEIFERLSRLDQAEAPSFADLLLTMPQDDGTFDPSEIRPREIEF
ncbi:type II toxin-antitoxin system Phd/YefM family antitoxin [Pelagibius sp.]|uniref:type II toxin-antitoxin system Phd/YefM family antitoxin n=1 Tax=Pelagibius sp. TaxID=1931238 RepID=UPI0026023B2A|nr:type II toxin-antitoxin system Phd/YefM family antitoxin [Pelagibius sp.]